MSSSPDALYVQRCDAVEHGSRRDVRVAVYANLVPPETDVPVRARPLRETTPEVVQNTKS